MKAFLAAGILLGLSAAAGCRPTRDECERAWDHLVVITLEGQDQTAAEMGKSFLDARKNEFVTQCIDNGRKSEVHCILKAKTKDDLDQCGK